MTHVNYLKTLISVGGWAETGGYFSDDGPCGAGTTSPSVSPTVSASPTVSPSAIPTGQYPAWTTGVSYTVGTRVSYQEGIMNAASRTPRCPAGIR